VKTHDPSPASAKPPRMPKPSGSALEVRTAVCEPGNVARDREAPGRQGQSEEAFGLKSVVATPAAVLAASTAVLEQIHV